MWGRLQLIREAISMIMLERVITEEHDGRQSPAGYLNTSD